MQVKHSIRAGVWIALVGSSCAPEHHGARERLCAGSGCTQECRELRVEACDIRDQDCRDLVFKSLQCVRGDVLATTPHVELTDSLLSGERDEPEVIEDRTSATSSMGATTSTAPSSDTTAPPTTAASNPAPNQAARRKLERQAEQVYKYYIDEGVKLLHFIPEEATVDGATRDEKTNWGGVQSDGTVVIKSSNAGHRWLSMQLLAHEFVHAQQEVDYGGISNLFERYPKTTKSRQSLRALIEGEADLYGFLTHAFMRNVSTDDWDLVAFFDQWSKDKRRQISTMDAPWIHADWWLHYPVGAAVLAERWQSGGNLAVRAVHHNLEPDFGAWTRDFAAPGGAPLSNEVTCSPQRTEVIVRDELGPSGVFALLMAASKDRIVNPVEPAWQLARALVDDKLDFFAPVLPDDETQSQWFTNASVDACLAQQQEAGADVGGDSTARDAGDVVSSAAALSSDAALSEPSDAASDAGIDAASDAAPSDTVSDASVQPAVEPPKKDCGEKITSGSGPNDDGTIAYSRLLPSGAVWLSWRLAFDTKDNATEFVAYFKDLDWQTVEVTRDGAKVLIKAHRTVASDEVLADFAAWDPWMTCEN